MEGSEAETVFSAPLLPRIPYGASAKAAGCTLSMSSLFAMASAAAFPQEKESGDQWWPSSSSKPDTAGVSDNGRAKGGVLSDVSEAEMILLQKYASWKRLSMICLGVFMFVTGCYNLGLSADNVPSSFLAVYLLFFSGLIVVFELGLQATSRVIVQNFGFLYNLIGRSFFFYSSACSAPRSAIWARRAQPSSSCRYCSHSTLTSSIQSSSSIYA